MGFEQETVESPLNYHDALMTIPPSSSSRAPCHIFQPDSNVADNESLVQHLTRLIVHVYTEAEAGIFSDKYERTRPDEVRTQLRQGRLVIASTSSSSPLSPVSNVVGCMRLGRLPDGKAEFGTFALDLSARGTGLGARLVEYGEERARAWGSTIMVAELVVPTQFEHPRKVWLSAWYQRMGYKIVSKGDFAREHPTLAPMLVTPVDYVIFEKEL